MLITDTKTLKEGDKVAVTGQRSNRTPISKRLTVLSVDLHKVEPGLYDYGMGGFECTTYTVRASTGTKFTLSHTGYQWQLFGARGQMLVTYGTVDLAG